MCLCRRETESVQAPRWHLAAHQTAFRPVHCGTRITMSHTHTSKCVHKLMYINLQITCAIMIAHRLLSPRLAQRAAVCVRMCVCGPYSCTKMVPQPPYVMSLLGNVIKIKIKYVHTGCPPSMVGFSIVRSHDRRGSGKRPSSYGCRITK